MVMNILRASNLWMVLVTLLSLFLAVATVVSDGVEISGLAVALLSLGVVLAHMSFNLLCCHHYLKSGFARKAEAMPLLACTAILS